MSAVIETQVNNRILVIDDTAEIHEDFRRIARTAVSTSSLDSVEALLFAEAAPAETTAASAASHAVSHANSRGITLEIDSAYQGQEGLELVRQASEEGRPYAMAFVDMRMPPGWDGLETIERIWQECPDLEVVICTAYSDYSCDEMISRLGRSDQMLILKKPFDPMEVRQLTYALTEKWLLRQDARRTVGELTHMVDERTRELSATRDRLLREISERETIEVALRHAQKLEAIGRLAAGVAHELGTPLQYIGDNVRFLNDAARALYIAALGTPNESIDHDLPDAGVRDANVQIGEAVDRGISEASIAEAYDSAAYGLDRVTMIVRAMRQFAQPNGTSMQYADVNAALGNIIAVSRNEYSAVARIETDFGEIPLVPCFIGDLNQALLHLIVNAAHAIADAGKTESTGGEIGVKTFVDGENVTVEISDNGTGISSGVRDKIFEPFFTTKEVGRGTGQGLSVVHAVVVQQLHGAVTFQSEDGRGTTFVVRLPLDYIGSVAA